MRLFLWFSNIVYQRVGPLYNPDTLDTCPLHKVEVTCWTNNPFEFWNVSFSRKVRTFQSTQKNWPFRKSFMRYGVLKVLLHSRKHQQFFWHKNMSQNSNPYKLHSVWKLQKSLIYHCQRSLVYILSEQKFIKNAKNGQFWRVFENLKLAVKQCNQTGQLS